MKPGASIDTVRVPEDDPIDKVSVAELSPPTNTTLLGEAVTPLLAGPVRV